MKVAITFICVGFLTFLIAINMLFYVGNEQTKDVKIKKLLVKPDKEVSKYLVFTEKNGIFEVTDSFFYMRFNSSDVFNKMKEGEEYRITTRGRRVEFFSVYQNIFSIEEL